MSFTRRHLPHWRPEGKPLFITFNLHGAVPRERYPSPRVSSAGEAFVWMDRYLDTTRAGPHWLRRPEIACLVADAVAFCARRGDFTLHAWAVMSNHVHLLVTPLRDPSKFLQSLKGYTALRANRLLGRAGEKFWQTDSYDHWVRNDDEFNRIVRYIERNPVKAGFCATPEEYAWSSAFRSTRMSTSQAEGPRYVRTPA